MTGMFIMYLFLSVYQIATAITLHTRGKLPYPPMGWMAWEAYRTGVSEDLIRNTTMVMVRGKWLASGYDTVHIDDGWSLPADP